MRKARGASSAGWCWWRRWRWQLISSPPAAAETQHAPVELAARRGITASLHSRGGFMHRTVWWLIMIIGTGLIGLIAWNALQKPEPPVVAPPAPRVEAPPPAPPAEPEIRHPVPEKLPEKPLPALETSDSTMQNALAELSGGSGLVEALLLQGF